MSREFPMEDFMNLGTLHLIYAQILRQNGLIESIHQTYVECYKKTLSIQANLPEKFWIFYTTHATFFITNTILSQKSLHKCFREICLIFIILKILGA